MSSVFDVGLRDVAEPKSARRHIGYSRVRGGTAVTMLTVYVVLLFAVPSNLQWSPLGSLGKPAALWGLILLVFWLLSNLYAPARLGRFSGSPVLVFFVLFCVVVLISYSAAMLRGQPSDQIGSATTSLFRIASWVGVLLVAADGVRTRNDLVTLFRRLTLGGLAMAVFGFAQLVTGSTMLDWIYSIPGWSVEWGGSMGGRGGVLRATATATHPLEFSSAMTALLPISIGYATVRFKANPRRAWRWTIPPAAMLAILLITVSRSAIIGLAVAVLALLPFLPRAVRTACVAAIALAVAAVAVFFPRVFMTTVGAFTGISDDASALSRTTALAKVPEFTAASPIFGAGWGTFLPRYYIFDNAWILMLVEVGILGAALFGLAILAGVGSALEAAVIARYADRRVLAGALFSALATSIILLALFDGLSFAIFAGTVVLLLGLSVAVRSIVRSDVPVPTGAQVESSLARAESIAVPFPSTADSTRRIWVDPRTK